MLKQELIDLMNETNLLSSKNENLLSEIIGLLAIAEDSKVMTKKEKLDLFKLMDSKISEVRSNINELRGNASTLNRGMKKISLKHSISEKRFKKSKFQ